MLKFSLCVLLAGIYASSAYAAYDFSQEAAALKKAQQDLANTQHTMKYNQIQQQQKQQQQTQQQLNQFVATATTGTDTKARASSPNATSTTPRQTTQQTNQQRAPAPPAPKPSDYTGFDKDESKSDDGWTYFP